MATVRAVRVVLPAPPRKWAVLSATTPENVAEAHALRAAVDKAMGFPIRRGNANGPSSPSICADGSPLPAGVPEWIEHWGELMSDARASRLAVQVPPDGVLYDEQGQPKDPPKLTPKEASDLRTAHAAAAELPTDWLELAAEPEPIPKDKTHA